MGTMWWTLRFRVLGTAQWKRAAGGEREQGRQKGEGGSDLPSGREVVSSSLRQSGGGAVSQEEGASCRWL